LQLLEGQDCGQTQKMRSKRKIKSHIFNSITW
jgi:hypothetical protein